MPKISILTPACDAQSHIARAARSLLAQSEQDFEWVIAADDARNYVDILAAQGIRDARIRHVSSGAFAGGCSNARNKALEQATGRVVATLDADDTLEPHTLAVMSALAMSHGVAYSAIGRVDDATEEKLPTYDVPLGAGMKTLEETLRSIIHTYVWIAFDREKLRELKWQEWIGRWEDTVFFAQCCDMLGGIYHHPEKLYQYHVRQGSICNRPSTANDFRDWAERILAALEEGKLSLKWQENRQILHRFFKNRIKVEEEFIAAAQRGECREYIDFVRDRRERFTDF